MILFFGKVVLERLKVLIYNKVKLIITNKKQR